MSKCLACPLPAKFRQKNSHIRVFCGEQCQRKYFEAVGGPLLAFYETGNLSPTMFYELMRRVDPDARAALLNEFMSDPQVNATARQKVVKFLSNIIELMEEALPLVMLNGYVQILEELNFSETFQKRMPDWIRQYGDYAVRSAGFRSVYWIVAKYMKESSQLLLNKLNDGRMLIELTTAEIGDHMKLFIALVGWSPLFQSKHPRIPVYSQLTHTKSAELMNRVLQIMPKFYIPPTEALMTLSNLDEDEKKAPLLKTILSLIPPRYAVPNEINLKAWVSNDPEAAELLYNHFNGFKTSELAIILAVTDSIDFFRRVVKQLSDQTVFDIMIDVVKMNPEKEWPFKLSEPSLEQPDMEFYEPLVNGVLKRYVYRQFMPDTDIPGYAFMSTVYGLAFKRAMLTNDPFVSQKNIFKWVPPQIIADYLSTKPFLSYAVFNWLTLRESVDRYCNFDSYIEYFMGKYYYLPQTSELITHLVTQKNATGRLLKLMQRAAKESFDVDTADSTIALNAAVVFGNIAFVLRNVKYLNPMHLYLAITNKKSGLVQTLVDHIHPPKLVREKMLRNAATNKDGDNQIVHILLNKYKYGGTIIDTLIRSVSTPETTRAILKRYYHDMSLTRRLLGNEDVSL